MQRLREGLLPEIFVEKKKKSSEMLGYSLRRGPTPRDFAMQARLLQLSIREARVSIYNRLCSGTATVVLEREATLSICARTSALCEAAWDKQCRDLVSLRDLRATMVTLFVSRSNNNTY